MESGWRLLMDYMYTSSFPEYLSLKGRKLCRRGLDSSICHTINSWQLLKIKGWSILRTGPTKVLQLFFQESHNRHLGSKRTIICKYSVALPKFQSSSWRLILLFITLSKSAAKDVAFVYIKLFFLAIQTKKTISFVVESFSPTGRSASAVTYHSLDQESQTLRKFYVLCFT